MNPLSRFFLDRLSRAHAARRAAQPQVLFSADHLRHATLLPSRADLLHALPVGLPAAELGVDEGHFSADILRIAKPAILHLVDPWSDPRFPDAKYQAVSRRFEAEIRSGTVRVHRTLSVDAAPLIDDASLGFVYIDTDHSYATTAAELRAWAPKLAPGGLLAGHDFLPISPLGTVVYGVMEAVAEFCIQEHWVVKYVTMEPGGSPSFALVKA